MRSRFRFTVGVLFVSAGGFAQSQLPPAPHRHIVTVSPADTRGNEPSIVSWSDYRNGDVDVFCASSADGGRTWSKPVRVNNDPIHDGIDQFFQWMTVDPVTGVCVCAVLRSPRRPGQSQDRLHAGAFHRRREDICELRLGGKIRSKASSQRSWAITPG